MTISARAEKGEAVAEYIERDAGICRRCFHAYVCEQFNEHRDSNNEKCHFFNDHFVPAADVEPVRHGRWETKIDYDEFWGELDYYECSLCGTRELRDKQTPYCANCGARMDLEVSDG